MAQENYNREILPVVFPEPKTYTELDVRNTKPPQLLEVTAPKDAPNVVIVLIDDVGFGATNTYGGPIQTPTMDKLAKTVCAITIFIPRPCVHQREWR